MTADDDPDVWRAGLSCEESIRLGSVPRGPCSQMKVRIPKGTAYLLVYRDCREYDAVHASWLAN